MILATRILKDQNMIFRGICLISDDVPALAGFYQRVFSSNAHGDDQHVEFNFAGTNISIFSKSGMERMAPGCMEQAGYGSFTMGFEVMDVDAEYDRLITLNVSLIKQPVTYAWGCRSVWFKDPDGNIIDFYQVINQ
jgi:hypothetical protein